MHFFVCHPVFCAFVQRQQLVLAYRSNIILIMFKSSNNFILFALLIFGWRIEASNLKSVAAQLNDKSDVNEEDSRVLKQQQIDSLNEQLNLLKEHVAVLSQKLNDRPEAVSVTSEQSNSSDYLTEQKLQTRKLDTIEKQISKIGDDLLEITDRCLAYTETNLISAHAIEPSNCIEATRLTGQSGVYEIILAKLYYKPFKVYCNINIAFGGWTVILRRFDGSVNFNKKWEDYKNGFGDLRGEFFIGLDKLHAMTTSGPKQELYFFMESFDGETKFAKYDAFVIGSEKEAYSINELGNFYGDVTDKFRYHEHQKFSTPDKDNDKSDDNCAKKYDCGWWFNFCYHVVFTGPYKSNDAQDSIVWQNFDEIKRWQNLKHVEMMIRPVSDIRDDL